MKLPHRRQFLHLGAVVATLPSLPRIATAADAYPSRAIYVIVGFTPGAAADVTARLLGDGLGRILSQQIVVESRPGAGSSIAADYVAHAPKDGYMLYLSTLSILSAAPQSLHTNAIRPGRPRPTFRCHYALPAMC